ncbi:MAG TPA: LytTR family DNA-binding domain-containing protein [Candidatus Fournierella pullicola]|uniref:Stage 0 sporulation protein A homolog n=1 Tax=Candidatus Allofournierella pullicola TaxID=2838596 RepID=A0A9D2ADA5_9FIRM|nr:LytTR family DNA-binding domain-containing protein [Candidatus Fournierella pullicola]
MISIAIVEDEDSCAKQMEEYLARFAAESGEEFETVRFCDGDEILENYRAQYDIILMDVQMKFMDGMTAAEEIRKVDPEVVIIFITNMAQYAIRGYAVDALDYVLKPVSYFAFSQRLERAIGRMKKRARRYMTIAIRGGAQKLDISHILYVESQGHSLVFVTGAGQHTTSGTIREVEEKLESFGFFRCNKGCLVNLEHVDSVRDGCAMVGGQALPISRGRKNEFLAALTDYVGEVVK